MEWAGLVRACLLHKPGMVQMEEWETVEDAGAVGWVD